AKIFFIRALTRQTPFWFICIIFNISYSLLNFINSHGVLHALYTTLSVPGVLQTPVKELVKVWINVSSLPGLKPCVSFFRVGISANGESGGLHRAHACCLHLVSPALAAPALDSSPVPPVPLYLKGARNI